MNNDKFAAWNQALSAVTRLAEIQTFPLFFATAATEIAKIFEADGAALVAWAEPGWLQYRLFYGLDHLHPRLIKDFRFKANEGTVGQVITTGTALFTPNYPESTHAMTEFVECGLLANYVVPIRDAHGPLGALAVAWTSRNPNPPDHYQCAIAETFAALISTALHREQLEAQLRQDSLHDSLTGLPNRRMLISRLIEARERARRTQRLLIVAMIDLDGFKAINDILGHEAGDRLLISCAQHISEVVRAIDMVARIGGDEFVLVFEDICSVDDAEIMLKRVTRILRVRTRIDEHARDIRASIGATIFPLDDTDPETLLRHADQAMYQAKRAGGDVYHFYDTLPEREFNEQENLREAFREAIKTPGQLHLLYQPIISTRTGRFESVEALVRWEHPTQGLLLPSSFLPAITNHSLMVQLSLWTLREALQQMQIWQNENHLFPVAINIGGKLSEMPDFVRLLKEQCCYHAPIDISYLQLEMIDQNTSTDNAKLHLFVEECQSLGIRIWFDDFGTVHTSLSSLREIPVTGIKIDRQFITNMTSTPSDRTVVEGLLLIAKAFQLRVIAKGVETETQLALLSELGCHSAQGYYIAKPMDATTFRAWHATHETS